MLYTWMISHYDDFGRMRGDPEDIKFDIFPRRAIDIEEISRLIFAMEDKGLLNWYVVAGRPYIQMDPQAWEEHQTFKGIKRSSKIAKYDFGVHQTYRNHLEKVEMSTPPDRTPQDGVDMSTPPDRTPQDGVDMSTPPDRTPQDGVSKTSKVKERCLSKDKPPGADSPSKHFSKNVGAKNCEKITSLCRQIQEKNNGNKTFNGFAFVQKMINEGEAYPQALIETLKAVMDRWDTIKKSYWAYALHIFNARNPQYFEEAHTQETQELKASWHQFIRSVEGEKVSALINQFARSP